MLALIALAGCMEAWGVSKKALDRIAGLITQIVFVRAVARLTSEGFSAKGHSSAVPGQRLVAVRQRLVRAAVGARFRRVLQGRSVGERLSRLIGALQDLEQHVDALVRRLKNGLYRRAPILPQRTPAARLHAGASTPALCADTS